MLPHFLCNDSCVCVCGPVEVLLQVNVKESDVLEKSPLIYIREWSIYTLLKSVTISLVLPTSRDMLSILHQPFTRCTFSLYTDLSCLMMRPTTIGDLDEKI